MLTAHAFNFEINADTQYLKFLASAGVRLFHSQSVADLNIHGINLPYTIIILYIIPPFITIINNIFTRFSS